MEATLFQRVQKSLLEKRQNLTNWLKETPAPKKRVQLGALDDQAIQAHMHIIDTSIGKLEDQTLGICEVCHGQIEPGLLEMDYTACVCLDDLSERERRQLETELEFLKSVQNALLPQQLPAIPGLDIAVFSRPAQIVGGDYFDFFQFRDGAQGLAIADAMGHGVSASMLMTSMQTALRTLVPEHDSPAEVLQRVNRLFLHNVNFPTFVTTFLGRYDPSARVLTYCNAGHNPPLFYCGQEKNVAWLQPTGAAIGLLEEYTLDVGTITFSDGDILLLYTDGVTEAINPQEEQFDYHRLAEAVQQNAGQPAQILLRNVRQALEGFTQGQPLDDDTTLLVCKIGAQPGSSS
jgi:sigma-B regulation protein RsbU (phosphoserine phosphatase)